MTDQGSATQRNAICQDCGGDVLLEVDFGSSGTARIYAECNECYEAGLVEGEFV